VLEEHVASIFRVEEMSKERNMGSACHLLHAGFLLGLFFNPEDGGDLFLRSLG
jgi:hypothetical protein